MSRWSLSRWGHWAQAINKVEGLKGRTQEAVKNLLFLCSLLPKSLRGQQTVQPPAHPDEPRLLRGSDHQLKSKSAQQTWDTLKIRVEKTFCSAPNARSAPWFFYMAGGFCRQLRSKGRNFGSITVRNSITFVKNSNAPEEEKATRHAEEWIYSTGTEMGSENSRV